MRLKADKPVLGFQQWFSFLKYSKCGNDFTDCKSSTRTLISLGSFCMYAPLHLFALSCINCCFSPPFLSGQFLCSFMLPLPSPLLTPSLPQMLNHPNYALFFSYPCASLFHPSIHFFPLPSICFTFPQYELFASSSSCLWVNYSSIYVFLHLSHSPFLTHSSLLVSLAVNIWVNIQLPAGNKGLAVKRTAMYKNSKSNIYSFAP